MNIEFEPPLHCYY